MKEIINPVQIPHKGWAKWCQHTLCHAIYGKYQLGHIFIHLHVYILPLFSPSLRVCSCMYGKLRCSCNGTVLDFFVMLSAQSVLVNLYMRTREINALGHQGQKCKILILFYSDYMRVRGSLFWLTMFHYMRLWKVLSYLGHAQLINWMAERPMCRF